MGGDWYFEEYTPGTGVRSIRPDANDYVPPDATNENEKKGILDLFGDTPSNTDTQGLGEAPSTAPTSRE
jgi:penicillin-binding protein 1A